jgi:hypothetical protein
LSARQTEINAQSSDAPAPTQTTRPYRHQPPGLKLRLAPPLANAVKALAKTQGKTITALLEEAALQILEDYGAPLPSNFRSKHRALKARRLD